MRKFTLLLALFLIRLVLYSQVVNDPTGLVQTGMGLPILFKYRSTNLPPSAPAIELVHITSDGKFGIGIKTPQQKLDVNGNISINDNVILLHSSTDHNHGIRYAGVGHPFAGNTIGGPVLYGSRGGMLGLKDYGNNIEEIALLWDGSGNIGIGTSSPHQKLDVNGNIGINDNAILLHYSGDINHGIRYVGISHPFASNTVVDGPAIYGFGGGVLGTKDSGSNLEKIALQWDRNGNIGIGTENTAGYKLAVNGSIRAKSLRVEPGWSDFVFQKSYQLMTLEELEYYIKSNGHLPDIPSAYDVAEYGIDIGEINAKLLQKVEELTLYILELNKDIKKLNGK